MSKCAALSLIAAVVFLGAIERPGEVEAKRRSCQPPRDASVVKSGSRVVMWLQTGKGVFACFRRTDRTSRLLGEYDKDGYWWQPLRYATNGDMAALVVLYKDKYGSDNLEVRVRNARRGAMLYGATGYSSEASKDATVTGFVLSRYGSGALAYSLPGEATRIELFWPAPDRRVEVATLDYNADPSGLRLVSRSQVEWTSNGLPRRANLPD